MKYGVLGDIHGNLSALELAVRHLKNRGAESFISVGDVVGYGAAPRECIALLREVGAHVVQGNHDAAVAGKLELTYFNSYAKDAVLWTRQHMSKEELNWLGGLPLVLELQHCAVAHGALHRPERFDYILGVGDAEASLDELQLPVCFVGHSHVPVTILRPAEAPNQTSHSPDLTLDLAECCKALVNVGSVGQPRDEDPRTAFALFDAESGTVEILREEYDIEREAARIRRAGLPTMLADRLYLGI
jgi:predicted phosphodiesterase